MSSYRAIVIGPPDRVHSLTDEVCDIVSQRDQIKNTTSYETLDIDTARDILSYEEFFENYPYLYHFPWRQLPNYLDQIENQGYNRITGRGMWFIAYSSSPGSLLEERRSEIIRYTIEDEGEGATTPFSYDPAQDFKTDM